MEADKEGLLGVRRGGATRTCPGGQDKRVVGSNGRQLWAMT